MKYNKTLAFMIICLGLYSGTSFFLYFFFGFYMAKNWRKELSYIAIYFNQKVLGRVNG